MTEIVEIIQTQKPLTKKENVLKQKITNTDKISNQEVATIFELNSNINSYCANRIFGIGRPGAQ